jgi:DNA polymerase elongation subunit (family B)
VNLLMAKLDVILNNIGMATVCHVPLSYLFLRGQGIKIFSLVAKKCRSKNFLIPTLDKPDEDNEISYEGATVITPKPAVYLSPIGVLDFNSLYPNSMRERNLTHECYVNNPKYDNLPGYVYHDIEITLKDPEGNILRDENGDPKKEHHRFAQEMITQEEIEEEMKDIITQLNKEMNKNIDLIKEKGYLNEDSFKIIFEETKNEELESKVKQIDEIKNIFKEKIKKLKPDEIEQEKKEMEETIQKICKKIKLTEKDTEIIIENEKKKKENNFNAEKAKKYNIVRGINVRYGILPEILTELLNSRKDANNKMAVEKDSFKKAILNSLQLAYKLTANSLYGQAGAVTSSIYFYPIAACTTAIGRERLYFAKKTVEDNFPGAEIIYGDTDSIFINFHVKDEKGNELTNKEALIKTFDLSRQAAAIINKLVPKPQAIVYEKTLYPLILVTKKKYVGYLYTDNPDVKSLKAMGIVLKRRDYAPIVKIIVKGIIDHILNNCDIDGAIQYVIKVLNKLFEDKYSIDKFIISKTLKAKYARPHTIVHKALAERMAIRDPGNKPMIGDRIPYVYIVKDFGTKKKKDILQGELVEHPEYVVKNKLKIDYLYYLEHQIMNSASQFLELLIPKSEVEKLFLAFMIKETSRRRHRQSIEKWTEQKLQDDIVIRKKKKYLQNNSQRSIKKKDLKQIFKRNKQESDESSGSSESTLVIEEDKITADGAFTSMANKKSKKEKKKSKKETKSDSMKTQNMDKWMGHNTD